MLTSHPTIQFGTGVFQDFPIYPYNGTTYNERVDQPFRLSQAITPTHALVQTAVNKYVAVDESGFDGPESLIESLYQIATGNGLSGPAQTYVASNHTGVGGVAFRKGSMPIVISITDAISHTVGEGTSCDYYWSDPLNYSGSVATVAHSRSQTKAALNAICARSIGIDNSGVYDGVPAGCQPEKDLEDFARATGAVIPPQAWDVPSRPPGCPADQCCTNRNGTGRPKDPNGLCPLSFRTDEYGSGLGASIASGLQMLTRFAAFDVQTSKVGENTGLFGEPLPPGKTTADFVRAVVPHSFTKPPPPPDLPNPTFDAAKFVNVTPGTIVRFQVRAFNDFVPQLPSEAMFFRATIKVLAGGCSDLDQREVLILIPPARL